MTRCQVTPPGQEELQWPLYPPGAQILMNMWKGYPSGHKAGVEPFNLFMSLTLVPAGPELLPRFQDAPAQHLGLDGTALTSVLASKVLCLCLCQTGNKAPY